MALRTVAAELGAALHLSDRTVQRRMADAQWRVDRFPLVWAAQGAGRISSSHARAIADAGEHLTAQTDRDAYSARMIEIAADEAPGRVAAMARRIAEQYQRLSLDERHEDAREHRRIWVTDRPDGMAELGVFGPAALVHGAFDRLTEMAKAIKGRVPVEDASDGTPTATDERTVDQLRADLALDTVLTGTPAGHDADGDVLGAITAQVTITVPVLTLLGDPDAPPAELDGCLPVDIETARRLAGAASGWDRVLTHPISGAMLASDRYRPPEHLRRHLRARDQRCRFPGCGRAARLSDIDHNIDAALGGPTREENLGHFCRRHHMLKHHSPWQVEQRGGGVFAWTSPTGQVYTDRPPPQHTVTFTESALATAAPF